MDIGVSVDFETLARIGEKVRRPACVVLMCCSLVACAEAGVKLKDAGNRIAVAGGKAGKKIKTVFNENKPMIQGCAAGAAGAGFASFIITRSKSGTVVSAIIGCTLGAAAAKKFDERRKKYNDLQQFHASELSTARKLNSKLAAENAQHQKQVAQYDSEIRAVRRATSGRSGKAAALRSKINASLERAQEAKRDALVEIAIKDELASQLEGGNDLSRADSLRAEADSYQRKIDLLSSIIDGYNRQTATIGGLV